jgi:hypothetical protein
VVGGCIKCSDFCLRVGECGGSTGSTQSRASRGFLGGRGVPSSEPRASRNVVKTSCRASLMRVGTWSRRFVRRFGSSRLGGQSF